MIYLESTSCNPYYNLALEEYVFEHLPQDQSYFMLWQNDNALIVGKYQNTAAEINAAYVQEHGIRVARRLSGGGAVYHDLGNLNYTFITDAGDMERLNLHAFCLPLANALHRLGVDAQVTGRNDVTIQGQKCSGSSQYLKRGRVMHHGCILFDANLSVVAGALNVPKDKIESKGVKSVRSRVTNIRPYLKADMGMEQFKQLLKQHMVTDAALEPYKMTQADIDGVERLCRERYSTWEWNYGGSPQFSIHKNRRVEGCGRIEVSMEVERGGAIAAFACHGDYFGSGDAADVAACLIGCRLEEKELQRALKDFPLEDYFNGLDRAEFIRILLR